MLKALQNRGAKVKGLDASKAAVDLSRSQGLDVFTFDIETTDFLDHRSDVVVSMEVGEHLPESYADRFVDLLCRISDVVILTTATPGQGGTGHVNEQPHAYWIQKFAMRDYRLDEQNSNRWRQSWRMKGVQIWYHANLMIFRKQRN